jgi:hypothetical protein
MSDKFDKLIADFPELYEKHGYSTKERPFSVSFGVGEGWFTLLYELSLDITNHVKKNPDSAIGITDIKEKFGTLRYYFYGGDETIENLIHKAERSSGYTCEKCGSWAEVMTNGGWLSTRCINCKTKDQIPVREMYKDE